MNEEIDNDALAITLADLEERINKQGAKADLPRGEERLALDLAICRIFKVLVAERGGNL